MKGVQKLARANDRDDPIAPSLLIASARRALETGPDALCLPVERYALT